MQTEIKMKRQLNEHNSPSVLTRHVTQTAEIWLVFSEAPSEIFAYKTHPRYFFKFQFEV